MSVQTTVEFEVTKWETQPWPGEQTDGAELGQVLVEKKFSGDLEGFSSARFSTAVGATDGSASYVAVEQIEGTLHGKTGGFAITHGSTVVGGKVTHTFGRIVPNSGVGELAGISGTGLFSVDEVGRHTLSLDYELK